MPKGDGLFPVVLWLHGAGGSLERSGGPLRQIAELGLAAVCFEYDQTNQAAFDAQMLALLDHVQHASWAQDGVEGWIANSLGTVRNLTFLENHPEHAPKVMVRLNGAGVGEKAEVRVQSAECRVQNSEFRTQETGGRMRNRANPKSEVRSPNQMLTNNQHPTSNIQPSTWRSPIANRTSCCFGKRA